MDDLMGKIQDVLNDEESMNQIKKLAEMFGAEASGDNPSLPNMSSVFGNSEHQDGKKAEDGSGFDFSKIMQLQQVMAKANKRDPNIELLYALRPLLKEESQQKVEKLVKIFKVMALWPVIKDSGILGGDLFDFL